jgi:hypothetical protein
MQWGLQRLVFGGVHNCKVIPQFSDDITSFKIFEMVTVKHVERIDH